MRPNSKDKPRDHLLTSPWLVIGGAVILFIIVVIFSVDSAYREKRHMTRALTEKGQSLITAFEAGARTGMMRMHLGARHLQRLIEETGKGPDIRYIVIADSSGKIISHSDPEMVGSEFAPDIIKKIENSETKPLFRVIDDKEKGSTFELFDIFKPMSGEGHQMRRRMGQGYSHKPEDAKGTPGIEHEIGLGNCNESICMINQGEQQITYKPPLFIAVGLDMAHFEVARAAKIRNAFIMAGIILVLGLSGFVSLFWLQNYRLTRQRLEDTSAFADMVISSLPLGLIATDSEGRIAVFNETMEKLTGIATSYAIEKRPEEIMGTAWTDLMQTRRSGQEGSESEKNLSFGSGKSFYAGVTYAGIEPEKDDKQNGVVLIIRDLTEIKELEKSLIRHEKLAAIGNLSAGVAHEIRNPLSSIKGLATYFRDLFPEGSDSRDTANVMIKEVDRINRVIKDLLEFSRSSELSKSEAPLSPLIDHIIRLVSVDATSKNIETITSIPENMRVFLDMDRVSQVLINLLRNSVEAMENGGILTLNAWSSDKSDLFLEVSDTGKGISEDEMSQIFNPYFTTKKDGTGLGLAVAQKIIEGHGGVMRVKSSIDMGTSVIIEIPRAVKQGI